MFKLPPKCRRGLTACQPLNEIVSDNEVSFICCGENDGSMSRIGEDRYTLCFKGEFRDDMRFYDRRDLVHTAAVIVQALAITEPAIDQKEVE